MGCQTNCVFKYFFLTPPLHPICDTDLNKKYKNYKKSFKKPQNPKKNLQNILTTKKLKNHKIQKTYNINW